LPCVPLLPPTDLPTLDALCEAWKEVIKVSFPLDVPRLQAGERLGLALRVIRERAIRQAFRWVDPLLVEEPQR
jgi:hypothetical protein